jgi:hypothetical protein
VAELGADTDPFMLHLYAALAEKERALISRRTKDALAAAKARACVWTALTRSARKAATKLPRSLCSSVRQYRRSPGVCVVRRPELARGEAVTDIEIHTRAVSADVPHWPGKTLALIRTSLSSLGLRAAMPIGIDLGKFGPEQENLG